MSETLLKKFDMNIIEEAKIYAEKYDVESILDLIDGFMQEKEDLEYKKNLFKAISEIVEFIRPMHT
ncbi:MAG: hypothetical protein ACE5KT_01710 [Methanosarcinales archaeon]